MASTIDAKGQTITSTYDALNRPTKQSFAGGADITITYDQGTKAVGHLSRIIDREGIVAFISNQLGRISLETREVGAAGNTIGLHLGYPPPGTWENRGTPHLVFTTNRCGVP